MLISLKLPHSHLQNDVWTNVWASCDSVKLTYKINHHIPIQFMPPFKHTYDFPKCMFLNRACKSLHDLVPTKLFYPISLCFPPWFLHSTSTIPQTWLARTALPFWHDFLPPPLVSDSSESFRSQSDVISTRKTPMNTQKRLDIPVIWSYSTIYLLCIHFTLMTLYTIEFTW